MHRVVVENTGFGRIEAQAAKQVIVQKVREAEREKVVAEYEDRVGTLINGTVKTTRDNIIVDLGNNAEGLLPRENLVGREISASTTVSVPCWLKYALKAVALSCCSHARILR